MHEASLRALGERRIIEDILRARYSGNVRNFGDDCALWPVPPDGGYITMTTDPCPHPVADLLGFSDYYYWGWLLSTINLSDLAAAGAQPVGLLTSLTLPADMSISDFKRLLDGIDECCSSVGASVVGGNLREGAQIALSGSAIGICDTQPMSRTGIEARDSLVVIGDLGSFWAGYFMVTREVSLHLAYRDMLLRNVLTPSPKVSVGIDLRRSGCMHACLDNSDGLYPSLMALVNANGLGVRVDFSDVNFSEPVISVANELDIDPVRFALGWGDWQLIGAVSPDKLDLATQICSHHGLGVFKIGNFHDDDAFIKLVHNGQAGLLMPLDSERFTAESWFETGVETYAHVMLSADLVS
jgi:thiamine-monophosphate kinase